jgi:hypothetical protein
VVLLKRIRADKTIHEADRVNARAMALWFDNTQNP